MNTKTEKMCYLAVKCFSNYIGRNLIHANVSKTVRSWLDEPIGSQHRTKTIMSVAYHRLLFRRAINL